MSASASAPAARTILEGPLPGVALAVDAYGSPAAPTVLVWLHGELGALDEARLADAVVTAQADGVRVLVPHLPGWGESPGGEHFFTIEDLALALWWAVERSSSAAVVLGGHGLGAAVAAEMAVEQPARVAGLLLAAPFGLFREDDTGIDLFGTLPGELMPHLYADPKGPLPARHFPPAATPYERGLVAIRRVEVLGAASRYLFPIPDTGIASRLYRVDRVPVTLVFGRGDGLVPLSLAQDWQRSVPHARIEIVEDAAHMVPYETDHVARLLAELCRPAGG